MGRSAYRPKAQTPLREVQVRERDEHLGVDCKIRNVAPTVGPKPWDDPKCGAVALWRNCDTLLYWRDAVGGHSAEPGSELRFSPVDHGIGDQDAEQSLRRQAELGRLLSAAAGYRVVTSDGTHVGWLDHVRYEQHADHPDEIVVRRRGLFLKRRRAFPFSDVETVRPSERTVVLRLDRITLER